MNDKNNTTQLNKIFKKLKSKSFDRKNALRSLFDLIEKSNQEMIRINALNIILELGLKNESIFMILEKCLLSDESHKVREIAARLLIMDYPNKCENVIKWALKNDRSPSVLKTIEDLSCGVNGHKLEFLDQ